MKTIKKIIGIIICFVFVSISCDKDADVIDAFEFELSENHQGNGYIYEGSETEVEIVTQRNVTTTYYKMRYNVISGEGFFQNSTGTNYEEGEEIEIEGTEIKTHYIPNAVGDHKVSVTVYDNKGNEKTIELDYVIEYAPFTLLLTSQSNSYIINAKNKIGINLLSERIIEGNNSFEISYIVDGGTGNLLLNEKPISGNTATKNNEIGLGTTMVDYVPSTIGEHTITAIVKSPDGATKEAKLIINVRHLVFDLNVAGESNQVGVNRDYEVTLNFTNEDSESDVTYDMAFEYGDETVGVVNLSDQSGNILQPGHFQEINPAAHILNLTTQDIGKKNLVFEIRDSNGQTKKDSLIVYVETIPINFKGSPESNNVYINQNTSFNFELTPIGDPDGISYKLQFNNTAGDGVLFQNNNALEPAFPYEVSPGSFSYVFRPTSLNQHDFDFIVTDSNGQEVSVTINVISKHVDLSFNASVGTTEMIVNNENNVTVSLIENNQYEGVTYELSYFILGGQGLLYNNGEPITASQYFDFNPGSTTYSFVPTLPGNYEIHLLLRDSNGQVLERTVEITALQTSYIFNATAANNNVPLGAVVPINFSITPNTTQNTATYTMSFENSNNGTFNIDGTTYSAGQIIELGSKNFQGTYTPALTGNHRLTFTVTDSNGVLRQSQTQLSVSDGSFNVTATSSRVNADVDDDVDINININEIISIGETYTAFFSSSHDGMLTINGNNYSPGQSFDLIVGDNTATYTGLDVGEHEVEFTIVSSSGNQKKDEVNINFTGGNFSFTGSSQSPSIMINEQTNLNFDITELSGSSTYQMRYEIISGNGQISDNEGAILQSGTYYNVSEGSFNWLLNGTHSGNVRIAFTVRNASSTEITNNINVNVVAPTFSFNAIPSNSNVLENNPMNINVNINDNGIAGNPYNLVVSSDRSGYIIYNGVQYSFGQQINGISGTFSFDYVGTAAGEHEISLELSNNYNVTNERSLNLNVEVNPYLNENSWGLPINYNMEHFGSVEYKYLFSNNIFETNPSLSGNLQAKWEIVGTSGNQDGAVVNWVGINVVEPIDMQDAIPENSYTSIPNNSDFVIAIAMARPARNSLGSTKTIRFTITNGTQTIVKEIRMRVNFSN